MNRYDAVCAEWLILDRNATIRDGWVGMEDGRISEVGSGPPPRELRTFHGGPGSILAPGFVCAHTHLALGGFRHVADDLPFLRWILEGILPSMERARHDAAVYRRGAERAVEELIRGGVTTVADSFPGPEGARAMEHRGVRGFFFQEVFGSLAEDLGAYMRSREGEWEEAAATFRRVVPGYAPHTPWTCPPAVLGAVAARARAEGRRLSIHVAESAEEAEFFRSATGPIADLVRERGRLDRYPAGLSPVEVLRDAGALGPDVLAVHCVHATGGDVELLASTGTHVVHCPRSNMKLAEGIAPVLPMIEAGVSLSLGLDSPASCERLDMFEEMRSFLLAQRGFYRRVDLLGAERAFEMATAGGARALGLKERAGILRPGFDADLFVLRDCDAEPGAAPVPRLVYGGAPSQVRLTLARGSVLYEVDA